MPKVKLTQARYDDIVKELQHLQTVGADAVAEKIKEARAFGDLSENSEYDEAKNEQGKLYSKIADLKNQIDNAEIISDSEISTHVTLGAKVTVQNVGAGTEKTYRIVGSQEADPRNALLSDESPIGAALIGGTVGDVVSAVTPSGPKSYEILKIEV
ncbi:MAG: transcription elongation factor GreA [Oscillospiraceae bacterium]|jgi:transcription elongation factor GreA|nr:transcription elongation factor GreA [Oscillospiraceae bacterium]